MIFDNLNRYRLQIYGFLLFYAKKGHTGHESEIRFTGQNRPKTGTPGDRNRSNWNAIDRKPRWNISVNEHETNTKAPRNPRTQKKSVPQLAVCGTDIRVWRKERDSNPRYSYPYTAFRVRPDRPLRHLSLSRPKNRRFGTANIGIFFIFAHFRAEKITFGWKNASGGPVSAAFPELFVSLTSSKIRPRGKMQASLLLLSPVRIFANGRTRFAHAVFSVRGRL